MPDKNINIDTDVILRYLEKTASPEEIRQLREWIALSEENANYFQEIRNIWEVTTPAVDPEKIDTGKALAKVKNRIHTTPQAPMKRTRLITYCRRIAAILLLPAIIAVVALLMKKDYQAPLIAFNEVTAPYGTVYADTAGQLEGLAERRKYAEISDRFHQQRPGSGNVRRSLL